MAAQVSEPGRPEEFHLHAEDIYMPSGPPMSPLTKSYFLYWGFFDLCLGIMSDPRTD